MKTITIKSAFHKTLKININENCDVLLGNSRKGYTAINKLDSINLGDLFKVGNCDLEEIVKGMSDNDITKLRGFAAQNTMSEKRAHNFDVTIEVILEKLNR